MRSSGAVLGLAMCAGGLWLWLSPTDAQRAPRDGVADSALSAVAVPTPSPTPAPESAPPPNDATTASIEPPAARPTATPISTLQKEFEGEPRDADAAQAEQRIREIFANQPNGDGVLRDVRCHQTVCKIQARWSQNTTGPYNAALVEVVHELSRELTLEPDGAPDGVNVPMQIYVKRFERAPAP